MWSDDSEGQSPTRDYDDQGGAATLNQAFRKSE